MKKYNVVWCVVDSVRKYHSNDDRSRLEFMDEFSRSGIEFLNVVTSAPSTVMSISAMMTSLPSYYLGRNYTDFRFDNEFFTTFSDILTAKGWTSRALIMHKDIREKLRVFDLVPRKYWPEEFSHRDWWDNRKIYSLLENTLKLQGKYDGSPYFWFLDFNCRKDPDTSQIVKDSFSLLNEYGYTKDNTIFVLCSDHGYPDPSRGITPEQLQKNEMTHDIFMTDDNITIPLIISYPGCEEDKKVQETISSLDIMPTLLKIIGIEASEDVSSRWQGRDVTELMQSSTSKYQKRKIRTDARFFGQSGRVTAIRDDTYKFVYHHDTGVETFHDVKEFNIDEVNIIESAKYDLKTVVDEFREYYINSEKEGMKLQLDYASYKLRSRLRRLDNSKKNNLLIISNAHVNIVNMLIDILSKNIPHCSIDIIYFGSDFSEVIHSNDVCRITSLHDVAEFQSKSKDAKYEWCIYNFDSSEDTGELDVRKIKRLVRYERSIDIDINMTISVQSGQARRYFKTLYYNRDFYYQEPMLFFDEFMKISNMFYNRAKKYFLRLI